MRQKLSYLWIGAVLAVGTVLWTGCSVNDAAPSPEATVNGNFFPFEAGVLYTYVRTNNFSTFDTVACWTKSMAGLQFELQDTATKRPLYTFSYGKDQNGYPAAVLGTDTSDLTVLEGTLADGAVWIADPTHNIEASVVTEYDDYYLPGRQEHFTNVLEVKYHEADQPIDSYTLRFFAGGVGLILERQISGSTNEISRLQLIGLQYPS